MGSPPTPVTQIFQAQLEERLLVDMEGVIHAVTDGYRRADPLVRDAAALEGRSLWSIAPFCSEPNLRQVLRRLMGVAQQTKIPVSSPMEQSTFAELDVYPLLDPDGEVKFCTITVHRRRQCVSSQERRLSKLIEKRADGLALMDQGGRAFFTSPAFRKHFRYPDDDFLGHPPLTHIQRDDAIELGEKIASLIDTPGGEFLQRLRVHAEQGDYRVIDVHGLNMLHDPDIAAVVAHTRDVTEEVARNEELKRAHAATKLALSAAKAMSWDMQPGSSRLGLWSESFTKFFGISEEEFRERGPVCALHPSVDPVLFRDSIKGEEFRVEFRGRDRDDGPRWYASYGRAVRNEHGDIVRLTGVTWDITAQRLLAEERKVLDQQIRESQKLESLGVLAGGIAHDFNNLLTAILGHANLASARAQDASVRMHLSRIEEASLRASELCRQMLSYAGRSQFALENTDLNRLIEDTFNLLEVSLSKKASLSLLLEPKLPAIEGDATQLRQVLMNLVINAAEALGEHAGQIVIRTQKITADEAYLTRFVPSELAPGDYVELKVEDTGEGMSPETVARIFEPFFSTKFTGRGLGLSTVRGIVKGHGGAMRVESTPDVGTTFTLLLPVSTRSAHAPQPEVAPEQAFDERNLFAGDVLLAEDEDAVRIVTQQMLESLGFKVTVAKNGAEAVLKYRPHMRLILMDMKMPELTGEEAWRKLKERGLETPTVVMSGHAEKAAMARLEDERGVSFLPKPFTLEQLRNQLLQVLRA